MLMWASAVVCCYVCACICVCMCVGMCVGMCACVCVYVRRAPLKKAHQNNSRREFVCSVHGARVVVVAMCVCVCVCAGAISIAVVCGVGGECMGTICRAY